MSCIPVCAQCRAAGCNKPAARPHDTKPPRTWAPNREPVVTLPCGCRESAWPVFYHLGKHITSYYCDLHGEVKWKGKGVRALMKKVEAQAYDEQYGELDPF